MRIAILTPDSGSTEEWRWAYEPEAQALTDAGAEVTPVPWTDVGELGSFDLVAPLVAWGYHAEYQRWRALLDRLEGARCPIANSVPLLRWNSDKSYLVELTSRGISTIPTMLVESLSETDLQRARREFRVGNLVVKPVVSASAYATHRVGPSDPLPEPVHGWRMLVQPWIEAITGTGEYSLIFFDGEFSHAVSKVPKPGEFRVQPEYGGVISPWQPSPDVIDLAKAALAAAPGHASYARVDLVVGNSGAYQIIELELIEPALFLDQAPEASAAFAKAMLSVAERASEQPLADR